jgi:hypothetical protein
MFLIVIAVALFVIWRYWGSLARVSPEEQEYDERMAALNERQANRLSDDQLTRPLSDDDAWAIMVSRGRQQRQGRPARRGRRALPPLRQERYGGDMLRRVDERRDRYGEPPPRRKNRPDE